MGNFGSNYGGNFDIHSRIRTEDPLERMERDHGLILEKLDKMQIQLDQQKEQFSKLISLISKLYQNNEINKDTYNRLDDFLKEYYDNPYNDGNH